MRYVATPDPVTGKFTVALHPQQRDRHGLPVELDWVVTRGVGHWIACGYAHGRHVVTAAARTKWGLRINARRKVYGRSIFWRKR